MNLSRKSTLRIGLLGCGTIAYWAHLRALRHIRGAALTAAADPDPQARERAGRLADLKLYHRAEDLLSRRDIDAVVICVPTHLHAHLATAAAVAGKHFYLEKPIATCAADAQRVLDAASHAGVIGTIGFNRRLHPLYQQARSLLARGCIGRVKAVQTAFCEPIPMERMPEWKRRRITGGGVLLDLASHHLDLLRWFLADEIDGVTAWLGSELSEQDTARLDLTMRGGVEVQSYFSFLAGLADFLVFVGERGTLRIDRHSPTLDLRLGRRFGYGARTRWIAPTAPVAAWRLHRLVRPSTDPSYRRCLQAFVNRLQGHPGDEASLADGARSLEAILKAEQSAAGQDSSSSNPISTLCVPC